MKYRALIEILNALPEEATDQDVTVYLNSSDTFLPVTGRALARGRREDHAAGVLDEGHFYLVVD